MEIDSQEPTHSSRDGMSHQMDYFLAMHVDRSSSNVQSNAPSPGTRQGFSSYILYPQILYKLSPTHKFSLLDIATRDAGVTQVAVPYRGPVRAILAELQQDSLPIVEGQRFAIIR